MATKLATSQRYVGKSEVSRAKFFRGDVETFGERYRRAWQAWREAHPEAGADEVAFVSACGIRPSTASPFKNMITPPPHERVLQIARTAGVDPGWLYFGDRALPAAPTASFRPIQEQVATERDASDVGRVAPPKRSASR